MKKFAAFVAMTALMVTAGAGFLKARTFAAPHVFEQKGRISNTPYTFDTTFFFTYTAGLAGDTGAADPVTAEVYLFNGTTGNFMTDSTGAFVCDPCDVNLSASTRKVSFSVEGAFGANYPSTPFVFGHAIFVVPSDKVAVQGYITNSHAIPGTDLAAFGFNPIEVTSARLA